MLSSSSNKSFETINSVFPVEENKSLPVFHRETSNIPELTPGDEPFTGTNTNSRYTSNE